MNPDTRQAIRALVEFCPDCGGTQTAPESGEGHYICNVCGWRWISLGTATKNATSGSREARVRRLETIVNALANVYTVDTDQFTLIRLVQEAKALQALDAGVGPQEQMKGLFRSGQFRLHSGGVVSPMKIDCDALTDYELNVVALWLRSLLPPFGIVESVPRGGDRLASVLASHSTSGPLLIVDDVLTTGASMEVQRAGRDAIGAVIFARGSCPSWVTPLFTVTRVDGQS